MSIWTLFGCVFVMGIFVFLSLCFCFPLIVCVQFGLISLNEMFCLCSCTVFLYFRACCGCLILKFFGFLFEFEFAGFVFLF